MVSNKKSVMTGFDTCLLQTMRRKLKFGVLDVSADKVNYSTPNFVKNELKRIGFKDIEHLMCNQMVVGQKID